MNSPFTIKSAPLTAVTNTYEPSANAWRVVEMLERVERDQADSLYVSRDEWTPAYRNWLARKIEYAWKGY